MSAAADPTPAPEPEPEPVQQPPAAQARPPRTGATGPRIPGIDKAQRVYVGNLAWSVSWQDLKDHMRMNGELNVNFCNVMGENGRSKGCGLVEYATAEQAAIAVAKLHDTELAGRKIFVREDREDKLIGGGNNVAPRNRRPPYNPAQPTQVIGPNGESIKGRQVFVGNLPWTATSQDLIDNFSVCGLVVNAQVVARADGRSAGFGTVLFADPLGAQNAIAQFNHGEFEGRPMLVKYDGRCS